MDRKDRSVGEAFLEVLGEEENNLDESIEYRRNLNKFVDKVVKRFQTPLKEEKKTIKMSDKKLFEVVCTYSFDSDEYPSEFNGFVLVESGIENKEEEAKEIFKKQSEEYYDLIHGDHCTTLTYTELTAKEVKPLNG